MAQRTHYVASFTDAHAACGRHTAGLALVQADTATCKACRKAQLRVGRLPKRIKRGYSREFTPRGAGRQYNLSRIPVPLWTAARAKAKAEGRSIREVVLKLLKGWVDGHPAEGIE